MSRSLFIGRWQPFHEGHKALVGKVLDEGGQVLIAVRDTPISVKNPYNALDRVKRIQEIYGDNPNVDVIVIPDIKEVCYGRDVGWGVRRIRLTDQIEEVSATKIRDIKTKVIWLTGNVGAGKTSIAYLLKERLNAVILDGDEMRASISLEAGFSKKDRDLHNLRVARLANVLCNQGHNVVVSVIAPFKSTRDKVTELIDPYWIYIKGGEIADDKPYEEPDSPHIIVDPTEESLLESMEKIVKEIGDLKS